MNFWIFIYFYFWKVLMWKKIAALINWCMISSNDLKKSFMSQSFINQFIHPTHLVVFSEARLRWKAIKITFMKCCHCLRNLDLLQNLYCDSLNSWRMFLLASLLKYILISCCDNLKKFWNEALGFHHFIKYLISMVIQHIQKSASNAL